MKFINRLIAMLKPQSEFKRCMAEARKMVALAKADRDAGYPCASMAALQSAMSWRAAAHAHAYYEAKA